MVATTFAADTPLVITGWVREFGIWQNWLWWCYAIGGLLTVFLFARYWRRGEVMTTAELAELRYGGNGAKVLRGFLGVYHATVSNTMTLCWVLVAAGKILDVLFGIDQTWAVVAASLVALSYCLMAGFWGVVTTDVVQFTMAMVGSIALAWISWNAVGAWEGFDAFFQTSGLSPELLMTLPTSGGGSFWEGSFWTNALAAVAVSLGVGWWAADSVDGGGPVVQRIAASKDERHGLLAVLWFNVAHYALRPWPWILVALASLAVLPTIEVQAPADGVVVAVDKEAIRMLGADAVEYRITLDEDSPGWRPIASVVPQAEVAAGAVIARTDAERAYPAMMIRFLPVGLLGLVVASLFAAFMSTIDTHVNLASSYFVNDLYRRYLAPGRSAKHYVAAARWTSAAVLALGAFLAAQADSIGDIFSLFLTMMSGVGPVYVLRWLWWRVRASTEITAMASSLATTLALKLSEESVDWSLGALSPGGDLSHQGRICIVVGVALGCALLSMLVSRTPEPQSLVAFYRKVRPIGLWGPVRALCPDVVPPRDGWPAMVGTIAGIAAVYGLMLGIGWLLLGRPETGALSLGVALVGAAVMVWALGRLLRQTSA